MSQKRVAVVLASLVGTLTLSAGVLLLMEGGALGNSPLAAAYNSPDVSTLLDTATPLRQGDWNYIIIYESGDLAGNSAALADGRLTGGSVYPTNSVRPKANFHFVVDNARNGHGVADGELEVGASWKNQTAGAPVKNWSNLSPNNPIPYYNLAVGVCLVGDLRREPISSAQQQKLFQLVRELQHRLNISNDRVLFQWQLEGSRGTPAQEAFADSFRSNVE